MTLWHTQNDQNQDSNPDYTEKPQNTENPQNTQYTEWLGQYSIIPLWYSYPK